MWSGLWVLVAGLIVVIASTMGQFSRTSSRISLLVRHRKGIAGKGVVESPFAKDYSFCPELSSGSGREEKRGEQAHR